MNSPMFLRSNLPNDSPATVSNKSPLIAEPLGAGGDPPSRTGSLGRIRSRLGIHRESMLTHALFSNSKPRLIFLRKNGCLTFWISVIPPVLFAALGVRD